MSWAEQKEMLSELEYEICILCNTEYHVVEKAFTGIEGVNRKLRRHQICIDCLNLNYDIGPLVDNITDRLQNIINSNTGNKQQTAQYWNNRYNIDKSYKIKDNLRSRVRTALKGIAKSAATMELIGCTIEALIKHLEAQFANGMTWDNYGFYGWHVDHIIPCASFDLTDPDQQKACFHYSNLQPLWAEDNLRKNKTWGEQI